MYMYMWIVCRGGWGGGGGGRVERGYIDIWYLILFGGGGGVLYLIFDLFWGSDIWYLILLARYLNFLRARDIIDKIVIAIYL